MKINDGYILLTISRRTKKVPLALHWDPKNYRAENYVNALDLITIAEAVVCFTKSFYQPYEVDDNIYPDDLIENIRYDISQEEKDAFDRYIRDGLKDLPKMTSSDREIREGIQRFRK